MRKLGLCLLCLLWVTSLYAAQPHFGAIILLDEVRNEFDTQGHEVWYEHERIEVLNQKGIQEFGEVVIPFSSQYQKLKVLKAVTILPNGERLKPAPNAYNIVSPPFVMQAPIYSDIKYQTISMPGLRPGAVIEYAYRLKTVKPYMPGHFWAKNFFGQEYPVKKAIYFLTVPQDKVPKVILYHINLRPQKIKKDGKITFIWKVKDLPAIDKEPYAPPMGELVPSIAVSSVPSWDTVAKWYFKLAQKALQPDSQIIATARKLTQNCHSTWEKIRLIYNYVAQNIRYVGVEFGISGYKPHPASQIFRLRYGDCKDHSTLLIAMLKAIGIKAYPVLIPTSEIANLDKRLPMPGAFDHEITAVKLKDKYVFLDSTAESANCGDLPPSDQGRRVLIIGEKGKAILTATPIFPSKHNQEIYEAEYWVDPEGEMRGRGLMRYRGVYAMFRREQFMHMTLEERRRELENMVNALSPGAKLIKMQVSDYTNLNQEEVKVRFQIKDQNYATKTSHFLLFHPPLLSLSHLISLVAPNQRKYPYCLGYCFSKVAQIKIHLPSGYKCQFLPENYYYQNALGELEIKWMLRNNVIKAEERLRLNQARVPAKAYPELRALFMQAVKLNRNQVIILRHIAFAKGAKVRIQFPLKFPLAVLQTRGQFQKVPFSFH